MEHRYRSILATVALSWVWLLSAAEAWGYECTHEVLPGETIGAISKRYGLTPKQLARLNKKLRAGTLRAGQKLKIKSPAPCQSRIRSKVVIRRGDTIAGIAKRHKMSAALLRRLNPALKDDALRAGQGVWVIVDGPRPRGEGGLYRLEDGPGYVVRTADRAYGSFLAVNRLMEVLGEHARLYPKAQPVRVDDISKRGGGFLAPHRSHRRGRDVDIRFPLKIQTEDYVAATAETLDVERTWDLLERFIKTGDVEYIFVNVKLQRVLYEHAKKKLSRDRMLEVFQFPRGRHSMQGIIRHEPGHKTHFHVRFQQEQIPPPPTS